jgi:C1A family cysteine protease
MTKFPFPLGALRDAPDNRDHLYGQVVAPVVVPDAVDYEPQMSPVKDQAQRGACVAFATCGVKEYQEKLPDLSEEFVYDQVRQPGGGAMPRDAMKLLVKQGVCQESLCPYKPKTSDKTVKKFTPTAAQTTDAATHKAKAYARILTIDELYQSLAQNGPCLVAVDWLSSWFQPNDSLDGYPLLKPDNSGIAGGHALCACGYDKIKGVVKLKNSWSATWGKGGFCYITVAALGQHLADSWSTYDAPALAA